LSRTALLGTVQIKTATNVADTGQSRAERTTVTVTLFLIIGCAGTALLLLALFAGNLLDGVTGLDSPFLSAEAAAAFIAAFGFTGALVTYNSGSGLLAAAAGAGAGVLLGGGAGLVVRALNHGGDPVIPSAATLLGASGVVTAEIRDGLLGEVSIRIGSHTNRYSARAAAPIPAGAAVAVTAVVSATQVTVELI
jgi:hypothetical protein